VTHASFRDPTAEIFTKIETPPYVVIGDSLLRRISAEGAKNSLQTQNDGLFTNQSRCSRVFRGSSATRFGDISSAAVGTANFGAKSDCSAVRTGIGNPSRHASESAWESDSHSECVTAARCASEPRLAGPISVREP